MLLCLWFCIEIFYHFFALVVLALFKSFYYIKLCRAFHNVQKPTCLGHMNYKSHILLTFRTEKGQTELFLALPIFLTFKKLQYI